MIYTRNPATEEVIASYKLFSIDDVNRGINNAHNAFLQWRESDFHLRKKLMKRLIKLLHKNINNFAELIANEMGKPITLGLAEIEKCTWACRHYAENAEKYLKNKLIKSEKQKGFVCYQPLGVIFAIMPWNFPFWQVFRFAAPNIMAGNSAILKHAPITTGCGEAIAKLFMEAEFPEYLVQNFILDNDLAAQVIANPKIRGVTLTGSDRAGSIVAANAGAHIKKTVLELGGNDPYLVLEDADLDLAAEKIVASRLNNCGQVCIAAKRIIAIKDIQSQLTEKIKAQAIKYNFGNPLDADTNLGPMARADLRDTLHKQVQESIAKGAKLIIGGEIPERKGLYYPPTILAEVKPNMPAFDQELFGPVISIISANNEQEAIELANMSKYGLGGAVFTRDLLRGEKIAAEKIEVGACFVNGLVASDPRFPFGGIKSSGYGRELSQEGILEFMNIKTVVIEE